MRHMMLCRISDICCWKCSGADIMPNGNRFSQQSVVCLSDLCCVAISLALIKWNTKYICSIKRMGI